MKEHAVQLYTEKLECNNFKYPGYVTFSLVLLQQLTQFLILFKSSWDMLSTEINSNIEFGALIPNGKG